MLGHGQFGRVYGGICRENGKNVAIKIIDKSKHQDPSIQTDTSIFQNEILFLCNFRHPGVIDFHDLFESDDRVNRKEKISFISS